MILLHRREQLLVIGRGEDNRRTGVGDFAQEGMDIEFGGDVDAAGRLVKQENARRPGHRAREHDLLLIAAAKPPDALARSCGPQAHTPANGCRLGELGEVD